MTTTAVSPKVTGVGITLRQTIKALMGVRGLRASNIYGQMARVSKPTWFSRMAGTTDFTAGELEQIAKILGVEMADLFSNVITLRPPPDGPEGSSLTKSLSTL